jgi:hypothetical protein
VQFISAPILLSHIYLMDEASAQRRALRTFYVARKLKGYRTMLTIANQHESLTRQKPSRTATSMGLGLVRLLLDAGRTEEARTTLASLQHGFQRVSEEPASLLVPVTNGLSIHRCPRRNRSTKADLVSTRPASACSSS